MNISTCIRSSGYRVILPAVLAVCAAALSAPALASNAVGPDVTVRFADLDVDSAQGATLLLKRIETAAQHVCAALDHGDLASRANRTNCFNKVTAAAVAKVNRPAVAAAYENVRRSALPLAVLVR
jgi:UrcA family protein